MWPYYSQLLAATGLRAGYYLQPEMLASILLSLLLAGIEHMTRVACAAHWGTVLQVCIVKGMGMFDAPTLEVF